MRIDTEFCRSCWLMLRRVLSRALTAKTASWSTARKTIIPTDVKVGLCQIKNELGAPTLAKVTRSGRCEWLMRMPCTTALTRDREIYADAAGTRPATAVVANRPT